MQYASIIFVSFAVATCLHILSVFWSLSVLDTWQAFAVYIVNQHYLLSILKGFDDIM
jgi:hypothetical protein